MSYRTFRNDPRMIRAKRAGVDVNGRAFKLGEAVLYYPSGGSIISGDAGAQACRDYQAAVEDEDSYCN